MTLKPVALVSFALVFGLLSIFPSTHGLGSKPRCRCVEGSSCWPPHKSFARLSQLVSQPLLRPLPPPSPCYSSKEQDKVACDEVQAQYFNGSWRSGVPGAMQNINFEAYFSPDGTIESCPLDVVGNATCAQGSVPPIGVDARNAEDIRQAVVFAKANNLKVVVKNTGHDYLGRSTAKGAFLIWVHHMKAIKVHDAFTALGAGAKKGQPAVTLEPGVQWFEVYKAVHSAGRAVVGGVSIGGTVGAAGGWVMGGGHSVLSSSYGLGVDNVLQFTLVTSEGKHVTANAFTNKNLFWALRGGGGGTYGVVTSVTYRTHPIEPVVTVIAMANITSESSLKIATEFLSLHPSLSDKHWGGYAQLNPSIVQFIYLSPNKSVEEANSTFTPFLNTLNEATGGAAVTFIFPFPSFYDWFVTIYVNGMNGGVGQVGTAVEISSRLLSRKLVERDPQGVAKTLLGVPNGGIAWNFVSGGAVSEVDPESTGLNPAWRKALMEVYLTQSIGYDLTWDEIRSRRERLKTGTAILDPLSVDSGAYLNEASLYEKDFKKSFFGSHYKKLKKIKDDADPEALFIVPFGVGSDEWSNDQLCREGNGPHVV